ncbi:PREDICTED: sperm acrosome membrane-associated protein 6-like [Gekko japonicus]|uniref:Sperm acrosome membrane-associated protein 6-like n=1 Tax=Gekko japonicus TaxID=146911 RepID=A0ABM1LBK1_GEKJA|nr:PREDICTED: sperm acrosome membrane-associated protein 6-like [Gekko japonicus]
MGLRDELFTVSLLVQLPDGSRPATAGACLYCFSTEDKRTRVCQYFLGYANEQNKACLAALSAAFQPYVKIQVVPYHQAIPEAAEKVRKEVEELKAASLAFATPPSQQPLSSLAGFQKEARSYRCNTCRITDCPLPINCPIQSIHKAEGDITVLQCGAKFSIPPERIFKWKFVKDVQSQDLSFFKDLYIGIDSSFLIRPTTGAHHGTYACEIWMEDDVLVRKFIFLNVTVKRLGKEKELQAMFHDILNPPPGVAAAEVVQQSSSLEDWLREPDSLHKTSVLLVFLGVVLSSMLVTLLLM